MRYAANALFPLKLGVHVAAILSVNTLYTTVKWFLGKFIDCRIFSLSFVDITHFFITYYTIPNKMHSYKLGIWHIYIMDVVDVNSQFVRIWYANGATDNRICTSVPPTGYPVSHHAADRTDSTSLFSLNLNLSTVNTVTVMIMRHNCATVIHWEQHVLNEAILFFMDRIWIFLLQESIQIIKERNLAELFTVQCSTVHVSG